jgi:hypothetical protein
MKEIILPEVHYTVESVAAARGITVQAVRKAIRESRLGAIKIANTWFISHAELVDKKWIRGEKVREKTKGVELFKKYING